MSQLRAFVLARPAVTIATIVSAIMLIGQVGVWILADAIANDFGVYWRTANGPLSAVYSSAFEYPFPYAPTMLLWIVPLKWTPMWPAFILWACISIAAMVWAVRPYLNANELWLLALCPPITNGLFTGQVSVALSALMLWAFGTKHRWAGGAGLGVIATIKPQLVLMAPLLLLLRSDWRAFVASAITCVLLGATSLVLFGPHMWSNWISSMDSFRSAVNNVDVVRAAMTPASVAERWGLPPVPFLLIGIIAGGWLTWRCRRANPLEAPALVATASLLAAPYGLIYDLAGVAPFLIWSIFRGRVTSAVAISAAVPPLPLVLTSFELLRRARGLHPGQSTTRPHHWTKKQQHEHRSQAH